MSRSRTPSTVVAEQTTNPQLPTGNGERFVVNAVMGLAFRSGHYLALRDMTATSIGPSYRAVWHRDPAGAWSMYTTTLPELSCPRYFSAAVAHSETVEDIQIDWTADNSFVVRMGDRLEWSLELGRTASTRMMTTMGQAMPAAAWRNGALLRGMGPMASSMLRSGRIRLRGATPNGPRFRAAPANVWRVTGSAAVLDGVDLGVPGPLEQQTRLADHWLPQRGIFFCGNAEFSPTEFTTLPTPEKAAQR